MNHTYFFAKLYIYEFIFLFFFNSKSIKQKTITIKKILNDNKNKEIGTILIFKLNMLMINNIKHIKAITLNFLLKNIFKF